MSIPPADPATTESAQQTFGALVADVATFLASALQQVDAEIRGYPTPIPRCDAQFNFLYEQRTRLQEQVRHVEGPAALEATPEARRRALARFVESPPLTDLPAESALRSRVAAALALVGSCRVARNIEIKARVGDREALQERVRAIADHGPIEILQDDTFFHCPSGRLKLRVLGDADGQLIHYERPDSSAPKESRYSIVPTAAPGLLRDVLAQALGIRGRVSKRRLLFLAGETRIHLDDVAGLGVFVELEVVLDEGADAAQGVATARGIMARLGIRDEDLVDRAYVDLLAGDI